MNEITLTKMKQMKLYGMHGTFTTAIETGKTDDYTLDEFVSMLVDAEWDDRQTRKIQRAIKNARFHYKASVENIIYEEARNIDKNKLLRLAQCGFIEDSENVLVTGSTGSGKSYIATALGYQACIEGHLSQPWLSKYHFNRNMKREFDLCLKNFLRGKTKFLVNR